MWSDDQREEFEQTGILKLSGAFTREQATAMADTVWRFVEKNTDCRRDDRSTWIGRPPVSFKTLKRSSVFNASFDNAPVRDALDGIFGAGAWKPPGPGGQILMHFPGPEPWHLPTGLWHMDAGFAKPTWPTFAVKLFACMADHQPGGGATLAIAGSHLLVDDYTQTLESSQFGGGKDKWTKFMRTTGLLDEIRSGACDRVVEMAGAAGDVYITHLHVFHCAAPNASDRPRMMIGKAVYATSYS